ncbi:MAG TPA: 2-oxo-4-hydroxy-4-carboxy-5-ureidoimidazoline decarboxylase [Jatrophihabitans sp.]|nr:2-oxo-4-hydroxy-4-carboxy-5-ureidoimidazoline decarboxylase [Jatrophihabitans sp.]
MITLDEAGLRACCAADAWVAAVLEGQPYASEDALYKTSDAATEALDDAGLAQALAGHPRIGERAESAWSKQEQSGMASADDRLRAELADANAEYERRFGHVYLVCASGRSAAELLAVCRARLGNDPVIEQAVVREELAKINRLRLAKLMGHVSDACGANQKHSTRGVTHRAERGHA